MEHLTCESCGMPLRNPAEHGGGNSESPYCVHCCDDTGELKSREQVRTGMVDLAVQMMGASRSEAEKTVDETMAGMPAWRDT